MEQEIDLQALHKIVGVLIKEVVTNRAVITFLLEAIKEHDPGLHASFVTKADKIKNGEIAEYEKLLSLLKQKFEYDT